MIINDIDVHFIDPTLNKYNLIDILFYKLNIIRLHLKIYIYIYLNLLTYC